MYPDKLSRFWHKRRAMHGFQGAQEDFIKIFGYIGANNRALLAIRAKIENIIPE